MIVACLPFPDTLVYPDWIGLPECPATTGGIVTGTEGRRVGSFQGAAAAARAQDAGS